jgi:hypothetical protein
MKITLNTPLTRNAIVPTADEDLVEIAFPFWWDDTNSKVSFRYSIGHLENSVFTPDSTSALVTISGTDYTTYIAVNPTNSSMTLLANLEKQLLQYLLDHNLVGPGTISS